MTLDSSVAPPVGELLNFEGRSVIVTGASRGIGCAIAQRFAQAGAEVVVHYNSGKEDAAEVVRDIEKSSGRAFAVRADLTLPSEVESLFEHVLDSGSRVEVLVNNAGIYPLHSILDAPIEEWRRVVDANLTSTHLMSQLAARHMRANRRGGAIVNVASIEGLHPAPAHSHYDAAKAGVLMYTRAAAAELAPYAIRVNAVSPGLIWREGLDADWPEGVKAYRKRAPLGRLGTGDDVADACLFLASPAARWITGANLVVDGGLLTAPAY
jgi:NAD(P)-dependent dehydrogenase (short-subunit alcohol dehydrogenase family)